MTPNWLTLIDRRYYLFLPLLIIVVLLLTTLRVDRFDLHPIANVYINILPQEVNKAVGIVNEFAKEKNFKFKVLEGDSREIGKSNLDFIRIHY